MAHPELHGEIAEIPPEGSLLPDTYRFGRNDTRQDIIERMQAAQAKFLAKVWETRDEGIVVTTPEEALILASIVEKETGRADERPLHRERVPEPAQEEHAAAVRPHHHLWPGGRQGRARPSHSAGRARSRNAI